MNFTQKILTGSVGAITFLGLTTAAFAQSSSSSSAADTSRPVPTQACLQALSAAETAHINGMDAELATRKALMQKHSIAITAAAAITDDAARAAAFKKANEDMRTAMKAEMDAKKNENQATRDAVKAACGGMGFGMHDGMGMGMRMMKGGPRGFGEHMGKHMMMRGPGGENAADDDDGGPNAQ